MQGVIFLKIVYLCLGEVYSEGYGYQQNLFPKYSKKEGHDVVIIASRLTYEEDEYVMMKPGIYINNEGIKVIRINYKYKLPKFVNSRLRTYKDLYKILEEEKPDMIFSFGLSYVDLLEVVKYKKKEPHCKLIASVHDTYDNSAKNFISKYILHKLIYKKIISKSFQHFDKIYVVTPACRDFVMNMYNISENKLELLFLAADTEKIPLDHYHNIRSITRSKLNISEENFVFISGGKLNKRKNIVLLLRSFKKIKNELFRLIIFGSVSEDIKDEFEREIKDDPRIIYIGWLKSDEVYNYYLASDVAIFPGSKSILWEQAIATGLPLICKRWEGMEYVDLGGNCIFIEKDDEEELINKMEKIYKDTELYKEMKKIAEIKGRKEFSAQEIVKRALNSEI